MIRFVFCILLNLPFLFMIYGLAYRANHKDIYTEMQRYEYARKVVRRVIKTGRITTEAYGIENLPEEGGYIMYPNHQGKYDVLGIMDSHDNPCTVVIDDARSHTILTKQFIDDIEGQRLKKDDLKQSVRVIQNVANETKAGRRYIIFPEGGYDNNHNKVGTFKPGSFKAAVKAKVPIVPVALIDSYRVFGEESLKKVKTQVHYMEPLFYDDYKDMNTVEISKLVSNRIKDKIQDITGVLQDFSDSVDGIAEGIM